MAEEACVEAQMDVAEAARNKCLEEWRKYPLREINRSIDVG